MGALGLSGLARQGLGRTYAIGMESIRIDGVHGDEILHHHLCPAE